MSQPQRVMINRWPIIDSEIHNRSHTNPWQI